MKKANQEIESQDEEKTEKGSSIVYDGTFFGQTPIELLRDPQIKLQTKAVYGLLHSYSQPKKLMGSPQTFVSQKKLAKDAGMSINCLHEWIKRLEESGWLTIIHRGLTKPNNYTLHSKKKKKK